LKFVNHLLSIYLLNELLKLIVSKEIIKIFFASISFLFFHISISYFFAPSVTNESIIYFSAIWFVPAIILLMARFAINGVTEPLKTISGAIWGIILNAIVWTIFFRDGDENIRFISLYISFFMVGILANKIPFNKLFNPLFLFPYFLILFGFIFNLLDVKFKIIEINNLSSIIILMSLSIVSSIVSSKIFFMKFIDTVKTESNDSNEDVKQKIIKLLTTKDKREKVSFMFIPIILIITIAIFVFIPQTSIYISQYIKSLTPNIAQFQQITVLDLKGNEYTINGWIVAEKDGVLYISNVNSQLEEIKVQNYFVKTNDKNND